MADKYWMRIDEAAYYARVGVSFLRKLIRTGKLPAIFTGRYYVIERGDIIACMERLKTPRKK